MHGGHKGAEGFKGCVCLSLPASTALTLTIGGIWMLIKLAADFVSVRARASGADLQGLEGKSGMKEGEGVPLWKAGRDSLSVTQQKTSKPVCRWRRGGWGKVTICLITEKLELSSVLDGSERDCSWSCRSRSAASLIGLIEREDDSRMAAHYLHYKGISVGFREINGFWVSAEILMNVRARDVWWTKLVLF